MSYLFRILKFVHSDFFLRLLKAGGVLQAIMPPAHMDINKIREKYNNK